jgi:hypothetical protein
MMPSAYGREHLAEKPRLAGSGWFVQKTERTKVNNQPAKYIYSSSPCVSSALHATAYSLRREEATGRARRFVPLSYTPARPGICISSSLPIKESSVATIPHVWSPSIGSLSDQILLLRLFILFIPLRLGLSLGLFALALFSSFSSGGSPSAAGHGQAAE